MSPQRLKPNKNKEKNTKNTHQQNLNLNFDTKFSSQFI